MLTIVFLLQRLSGDPTNLLLPVDASRSRSATELRRQLGLDQPILVQYLRFLGNVAVGDLGDSYRFRQPALGLVLERLPATLLLAGSSLLISLVIALPLGILAAVRRNTWVDTLATGISLIGQAMPVYWLGLLGILLFAVQWRLLPSMGGGSLAALVLPATTLAVYSASRIMRLTRSAMLDVLHQDYIRMARAKGLSEAQGADQARAAQRLDPDRHDHRPAIRRLARRRRHHRDGVCLARRRTPCGQRGAAARFPGRPGGDRRHRVRLLAHQPDGRSSLCAPQSRVSGSGDGSAWLFGVSTPKGMIGFSDPCPRCCSARVAAPWLAPLDPNAQDLLNGDRAAGHGRRRRRTHWLGTDRLGQDVLSRIIYGSRVSLITAFAAVAGSASIGTLLGLVAGYFGGWVAT